MDGEERPLFLRRLNEIVEGSRLRRGGRGSAQRTRKPAERFTDLKAPEKGVAGEQRVTERH